MKKNLPANKDKSSLFIGPGGQVLQPVTAQPVKEDFAAVPYQTMLRCLENLAESNAALARTNLMLTAMILRRMQE